MSLRIYELLRVLINLILGVIAFFLVLRIILVFFSANPSTPFVAWIFDISNALISPFSNIVPNLTTATGVLDIVAILSLVAYLIIGSVLLTLIPITYEDTIIEEDYPATATYHDVPKRRRVRVE